jgi:hypothetical protein
MSLQQAELIPKDGQAVRESAREASSASLSEELVKTPTTGKTKENLLVARNFRYRGMMAQGPIMAHAGLRDRDGFTDSHQSVRQMKVRSVDFRFISAGNLLLDLLSRKQG